MPATPSAPSPAQTPGGTPNLAVVGHVEWVQFAQVDHVPQAGQVAHARHPFEEPAGGGGVAAVQLARLAGHSSLVSALGDDHHGRRARQRLGELGVEVWASSRTDVTRRAMTLVDEHRERTIVTLGSRLEPRGSDRQVPWEELSHMDAVYFTAGDLDALRAARTARTLVVSPRAGDALGHGVALDALVLSADDATERALAARAEPDADLVVLTDGARGGTYRARPGGRFDGASGRWAAVPLPGEPVDSYGCGDSFAAGLTYALGVGLALDRALQLAARCGAVCLTGHGPYERQLTGAELDQ